MKCEFSKKDLESMIGVFFQKRCALLENVTLEEFVSEDKKSVSLKCCVKMKKNICGVEKVLEKELDMEEIKTVIDVALKETLEEDVKLNFVHYQLGFLPYGSVATEETYFHGIEVDLETVVDRTVNVVNEKKHQRK